jgi:hypothetical protein
MAQTTSDLWKTLWRANGTTKEYKWEINGETYGADAEVSHSVTSELYSEFGIGNAYCATLSLDIIADNIPKDAVIKRYVRLVGGGTVTSGDAIMDMTGQTSEWLPKGVYYLNTRSVDGDYWTIEAYDAMKKAEVKFLDEGDPGEWGRSASDVVDEIAERIGVELDSRTTLIDYTVSYPNDLTMREILCHIAAVNGGNWIITDAGKLYLVPLLSAPTETNYLVDEYGDAILIGGDRILV